MPAKFQELTQTDSVRQAEERYYGRSNPTPAMPENDRLTANEIDFIQSRDSFYMASVSETGWPYIQHRGGERGFLRVLGAGRLAFADFTGNGQLLSVGNIGKADKVALFLMDYPRRTRLKILGRAQIEDARGHSKIAGQFSDAEQAHLVERLFFIEVIAFDWNCPQHITPRFALDEMKELILPLLLRIEEMESRLVEGKG